nr:PREDICTED: lysophosphatidic acid phosphatase type 6 [Lepisosteus oculatus]
MNVWARVGIAGAVTGAALYWHQSRATPAAAAPKTRDPDQYELKLVQALFRHGARTPLKSIPGVPEAEWLPGLLAVPPHTRFDCRVCDLSGGPTPPSPVEDSYRARTLAGGVFPGQLTTLGMQQLYDLGKRMRETYIEKLHFLSPAFTPAEVYVRSTNIIRTIESARCLLAGLFQQKQKGPANIFTSEAEVEILYPNIHGCKLLYLLGKSRWEESFLLPEIADDLKKVQSALGIAGHKGVDFVLIRDDMVARETHGLPGPAELQSWKDTVEQRAVEMINFAYQGSGREVLQVSVGPLLHTLVNNIEEKLQGEASSGESRKMYLYSVHDTTLMPCLIALGIFDWKWPPYGADITVELYEHRTTKEDFVKVSYIGQAQLIRGCSDIYCPLKEFKKALSSYTLELVGYRALCNKTENCLSALSLPSLELCAPINLSRHAAEGHSRSK